MTSILENKELYQEIETPFIGRSSRIGYQLHVIGNWDHFMGSMVPKMFYPHGVTYHKATDESPVGPKHSFIYWYNRINGEVPNNLMSQILRSGQRVINFTKFTHAKSHSDRIFEETFGYPISINPTEFKGIGVSKGNLDNGAKSGSLTEFPITDPNHDTTVYQKLIHNVVETNNGCYTYEYRAAVIDGEVILVSGKIYEINQRFKYTQRGKFYSPYLAFSPTELHLIRKYCKNIGFDFGEIDILRDLVDDKIYIIDANATPYYDGYSQEESNRYLHVVSTAAMPFFWPGCNGKER